jgi:Carboxypeptidase regulatory-like domain
LRISFIYKECGYRERGTKWRVFVLILVLLLCLCASRPSKAQQESTLLPDAPRPQPGIIVGTVTDVNNDTVPGATVVLEDPILKDPRTVISNNNGFFQFNNVEPGSYHVTVSAQGFADWTSPAIILKPGQYAILTGSKLRIAEVRTTINVTPASSEEIAREQVKAEEQQRIFGIVPNFYVVYDHNAAPLTTKLKFQLATKVLYDPVTIFGVAAIAGINQAGDVPNYGQGAKGYAERFGAAYASGATDIMIGGTILPSLLHQDPRYFYQGTGTKKSRAWHAVSSTFICRGDNGQLQPNYSTIGGDLAAAAIATTYYPPSDRGPGRVFGTALINTGERALANLAQEFILRRITHKAKEQK